MKLININQFPKNYNYVYGDLCELDEYDRDRLKKDKVDIFVYWYASGSYEGSGKAIFCVGNKWFYHDLGHCSCYGPIENISYSNPKDTVQELYDNCSDELKKELKPVYDRAKDFDIKAKCEIFLK